jgi:hypothetical protein
MPLIGMYFERDAMDPGRYKGYSFIPAHTCTSAARNVGVHWSPLSTVEPLLDSRELHVRYPVPYRSRRGHKGGLGTGTDMNGLTSLTAI